jgi:hypothetical protein
MTRHEKDFKTPAEVKVEIPGVTPAKKPRTRAQRVSQWKKENKEAFEAASRSCCMCTPSKADMLMYDRYNGDAEIPDEILPE